MKLRSLYTLSVSGLLLVVAVQIGGMIYAYDNSKKVAVRALNECFRLAFIEAVDNEINKLPFPDWTIPFYTYIPRDSALTYNDQVFLGYQQAAAYLEDEYHVTVSLDEMARLVEKKLKWKNIDRTVWVDAAEDPSKFTLYRRFKTVVSEPAWLNRKRGLAINATILSPSLVEDILFLFLPTLLLSAFLIKAWTRQMDSIKKQQNDIDQQRSAFYALGQKMRLPVTEVRRLITGRKWNDIEVTGRSLLELTEQTLAGAKEGERRKQVRKQHSFTLFSIVGLVACCLLLAVWFAYLYRASLKETTYRVNDCFEAAFYNETFGRRIPLLYQQHSDAGKQEAEQVTELPFALRQREAMAGVEKDYVINRMFVMHIYNSIDLDYRLRSALIMQRSINESGLHIPLSMQYLDSAFAVRLSELGMRCSSGIRQFTSPADSTVSAIGYTFNGFSDLSTRFIPLKEDSALCVQGMVKKPYRYIVGSVWYLFLPLWLMFLVLVDCMLGQFKVQKMQRRLEQFQKDFSYAMIHDMKSPLSSILMGAHVLNSGKLSDKPDKEQKYIQAMTDECEHLLTLSNRVLVLTQFDEGHLQLNKEEVPLRALLDDLAAKISLKAGKTVDFNIVLHRCETVYADAFCLREVLVNLIENAVKYSRSEVKIDIICVSEKGFSKIKVCDNGLGIPLKDQMRIFNRFERSAAATRSNKGGATGFGLGLNYVLQVMLAHEGRVEVESEEGRFSEFTLYFPVSPLTASKASLQ